MGRLIVETGHAVDEWLPLTLGTESDGKNGSGDHGVHFRDKVPPADPSRPALSFGRPASPSTAPLLVATAPYAQNSLLPRFGILIAKRHFYSSQRAEEPGAFSRLELSGNEY